MSTTSIPAFHVSNRSKAKGKGEIYIQSRDDAIHSGTFIVKLSVQFDPAANDYPTGNLTIKTDLSDANNGTFEATTIELINSYGKHNPTIYLTGQCKGDLQSDFQTKGFRYWMMIANNKSRSARKGTPDVVGFVIHDRNGVRIAYGTGPVKEGDFEVAPN